MLHDFILISPEKLPPSGNILDSPDKFYAADVVMLTALL